LSKSFGINITQVVLQVQQHTCMVWPKWVYLPSCSRQ